VRRERKKERQQATDQCPKACNKKSVPQRDSNKGHGQRMAPREPIERIEKERKKERERC
jgi:hypothetical protein